MPADRPTTEQATRSPTLPSGTALAGIAAMGSAAWMCLEGLLLLWEPKGTLVASPLALKVLAYLEAPVGLMLAGSGLALLLTRRKLWLWIGLAVLLAWAMGNLAGGYLLHRHLEAPALLVPKFWGIAGISWAVLLALLARGAGDEPSLKAGMAPRLAAGAVPLLGSLLFVPASQMAFSLWLMSRDILLHTGQAFPTFYQNVVTKHFLQASSILAAGAALGALLTLPAGLMLLRGSKKWGVLLANVAALLIVGCSLGAFGVLDRWGPHVHFLYRRAYVGLVGRYARPGLGAGVVGLLLADLPLFFRTPRR